MGLYSGGGGAYIWNEVSVSTCGGLIHRGAYSRGGGLIVGGLRYPVTLRADNPMKMVYFLIKIYCISS